MIIKSFLVGGTLCLIAQILIDKTKITPAKILVSYVVCGVIISGLGLYQPLVDFAGAGATVPLTGFGHSLASGVKNALSSQGAIGIVTGGITATAGGITVAIISALLIASIFRSRDK